jgi:hypothetical protein
VNLPIEPGQVSRRAFLGLCGATVGAMTIDPEALLWVPGERTIFLPPAAPATLVDTQLGISLRFVQQREIQPDGSRSDVLTSCVSRAV